MLPFYFYCGEARVTDINMICCSMRLIEVKVLSHDLRDNGICTRLSHTDCNIRDDGGKLLAEGLKSCIQIEMLLILLVMLVQVLLLLV